MNLSDNALSSLRIIYQTQLSPRGRGLLCVTHTERPTELDKCDLNYLQKRYGASSRLPPPQPFKNLRPSIEASPYKGNITVWNFDDGDFAKPRLLLHLSPEHYKPQHTIWYQEKLWILGVEVLEVLHSDLHRVALVTDPWLSGAHTLMPDGRGNMLITCSASDAVLVMNERTFKVDKALRLPEALYGHNYPLVRTDSVVDHYISNDYQLTHINCASPWNEGIVISTLIQGAIGWFSESDEYTELLRGFVGCHGVRVDARDGRLYFTDSCLGAVVFLSPELTIARRLDVHCRWLHDACQLEGPIFAVAVADRNTVEIWDEETREIIVTIPCDAYGKGTQFLSYGG